MHSVPAHNLKIVAQSECVIDLIALEVIKHVLNNARMNEEEQDDAS